MEWGGAELGRGVGKSKKEAEIAAAMDALTHRDVLKLEEEGEGESAFAKAGATHGSTR